MIVVIWAFSFFFVIMALAFALANNPLNAGELDGDTGLSVLGTLAAFLGLYLGLWIVLRVLHKRPMASLFGPRRYFWPYAALAFLAVVLAYSVLMAVEFAFGRVEPADRSFSDWAFLAALAFPLIFIQSSAEELVMRGYLLQQLAARFRHFFAYAVIPSALFGFAHYDPTLPETLGVVLVISTFVLGLLLADLTARTGSLGIAVGFHFANNLIALLVVGVPQLGLSALALFHHTASVTDPATAIWSYGVVPIAIFVGLWTFARWAIKRRDRSHEPTTASARTR
ncbi:MAG: type II CAAX endopeptidase family protein [Pseudomonadota bacterium]